MVKITRYKLFISPYRYSLSSLSLLCFRVYIQDIRIGDHLAVRTNSQLFWNILNAYV